MLTHTHRNTILDAFDSHFCGLITAISDWRAGTVTEASYTGYGTRPSITLGATANTSPAGGRQRANSSAITFPANTGSNQDVIGWGIWTASTAGTLKWISLLDDDPPIIGTGATDNLITTQSAHGLVADQRVFVIAAPGAELPAGLSENTAYFVLSTGLTTTAFKVATTSGGTEIDITAGGAAMFMPYKARTVAGGSTPEFAIGAFVIQL